MIITALVLAGVFAFLWLTARFWIQWWWFESIGYQTALTTRYISGAIAFVVAALLVGGFFAANWNLALRRARARVAAGVSPRASSALAAMALDGRLGAVRRLVRCGTVGDLAACIRRNQHRRSVFGMDAGFPSSGFQPRDRA